MKNSLKAVLFCVALVLALQACKHKKAKPVEVVEESYTSGKTQIIVDESFAPIIDEEAFVFKALYKKAKPEIIYKPETEVLNIFLNDSIRLAILSRNLNENEIKLLKSRTLPPIINKFAMDAVVLIVNNASNDTTISVDVIKKMLNGQANADKNIVFDNPNSSLARYLKDLSGNKELKGKNIYALNSNKDVIRYVSEHPAAIGITGFSWLDDPDKDYADAVSKVKMVAVKNEGNKEAPNQYFLPSQTTLALNEYPLSRSLYIINCTGKYGLGTGFAAFLQSERGQRIILKSGLLPDSIPGREVILSNKLKL